jgi:desulfoferrodoxin (superoxide reductase-like protein)
LCQYHGSRVQLNLMKNKLVTVVVRETEKFPVVGLAAKNCNLHGVFFTQ